MPIDRVVGQVPPALVDLALWIAAYYGSTPARALALVAPELPKRRKEQAPPAERQSFGGEAEPDELLPEQRVATDRIVSAIDAGLGRRLPALRADRIREDRGLPPGLRCRARAGARGDPARAGDLAGAADGRTGARPLRRPGRDPPLRAHRCGAARRARADRERRGADRRRGALCHLRAGARARADRGRRGARGVVQAGLGSALRRANGCGQARRAGRARSPCSARRRRAPRAGRRSSGSSWAAGSAPTCRRSRSSTCAGRRGIRCRRRCSASSGGCSSRTARRCCCSTAAGSRRRSTAGPAAARSAAPTATSRSCCTATPG